MRWGHKVAAIIRWLGLFGLALAAGIAVSGAQHPGGAASPAAADTVCTVTKVTDGDTLHIDCGHGDHRTRLMGYDTPEIYHPKCAAEKKAGEAETRMMATLVASGPVTGDRVVGKDRYGRDLAWVSIGGKDVSATMLETPWARPYSGHAHPDWCGIIAAEHLPDSAFGKAMPNTGG